MSQRQTALAVLRAILRCARHRRVADAAGLLLRVDCSKDELKEALDTLKRDGLVFRSGQAMKLTLPGLAVAVAALPRAKNRAPVRAQSAA